LSYYEYNIIFPMPPVLGERTKEISQIEDRLKSLNLNLVWLFSLAQKFREEGTFIEVDVPKEYIVKEAYPFYSIGVAEEHIYLNWNSSELEILGKGS